MKGINSLIDATPTFSTTPYTFIVILIGAHINVHDKITAPSVKKNESLNTQIMENALT